MGIVQLLSHGAVQLMLARLTDQKGISTRVIKTEMYGGRYDSR